MFEEPQKSALGWRLTKGLDVLRPCFRLPSLGIQASAFKRGNKAELSPDHPFEPLIRFGAKLLLQNQSLGLVPSEVWTAERFRTLVDGGDDLVHKTKLAKLRDAEPSPPVFRLVVLRKESHCHKGISSHEERAGAYLVIRQKVI